MLIHLRFLKFSTPYRIAAASAALSQPSTTGDPGLCSSFFQHRFFFLQVKYISNHQSSVLSFCCIVCIWQSQLRHTCSGDVSDFWCAASTACATGAFGLQIISRLRVALAAARRMFFLPPLAAGGGGSASAAFCDGRWCGLGVFR